MKPVLNYYRNDAVDYAHKWAYGRNPAYYNYEDLGGDCTNFVSQCIFAGGGVMNYTRTFGWYYINGNDKAPAWTGVMYLNNFLTRGAQTAGPVATRCNVNELQAGDVVQLSFTGDSYAHTLLVVSAKATYNTGDILVAAHSFDADNRALSSYYYKELRCLHITGIYGH